MNKRKSYSVICGNCGKSGHYYKDCTAPIISLGVICCKVGDHNIDELVNTYKVGVDIDSKMATKIGKSIKYLMICRKHSMSYVEFIRGKYEVTKPEYIIKLFKNMTYNELMNINKENYDRLYDNLWKNNVKNHHHHNEYVKSSKKFEQLRNGSGCKSLHSLIGEVVTDWSEPEWGFPKGRRNNNESDIACAKREFEEETNLTKSDYRLLNIDAISEVYTSVNRIRYKHIYYLAQSDVEKLSISKDNSFQAIEIGQIGWFSYEEALGKIRTYQVEKMKILKKVHTMLVDIIACSLTDTVKGEGSKVLECLADDSD